VRSRVGLSATPQYEWMLMETNRRGTDSIEPTGIIAAELASRTGMYAVSTSMTMQKVAANLSYRIAERNALLLTVPYVINDMDMKMGMKMMDGGPITYTDMTMDTVRGIGDVSLLYVRDVWEDIVIRTRRRLSVGIGVKFPTGDDGARNANGALVHMMMQAGTGSVDGLLLVNGVAGFGTHRDGGALFLLAPSLTLQLNTRNDRGYRVGNHLNYDLSGRYRVTSKFVARLDLNGVWSAKDDTDGTIDPDGPLVMGTPLVAYQNVMGNVLDNVDHTGLHSIFLSPGFQWLATRNVVIGGEWRAPVYQDVNGIQQVTDRWFRLMVSAGF
ncbi:hypothetical protein K8I85_12780, partial [bacterium]|nr:hypothetical protein [bacterium]